MKYIITITVAVVAIAAATACYAEPNAKQCTVLAFGAEWCIQCKYDHARFPEIQEKYGELIVYDWDWNPDVVSQWGVTILPTYIVVMPNGETYVTYEIGELL